MQKHSVIMKIYKSLGFLVGFCLASITTNSVLPRPGKVIIDTDAGSDDAAAILLALATEKALQGCGIEIIAITCSYGNTKVTNVELNVLKILTVGGRSDIPVYVGSHKPLMQNYTLDEHFGKDGLGDTDFDEKIKGKIDRSKHASVALVDLARKHAGNVSILAIAPVTNIAVAMALDPNFVHNVERFYIMGSSPHGRGSIAPDSDFNFYQDPESNFIVLNSTTKPPAVLLPSGVSSWASISTKWRTDTLGALNSRRMNFLNKIERKTFTGPVWKTADLILAALALWPDLITRTTLTNITPVYDGAARGAVLADYRNTTGKQQNAILLEEFDVEGFQKLLLKSFALFLPSPGKVIIDTDAGGDDAGAILLAIAHEEMMRGSGFEIIAITCVYGNTKVTNVELNVRKILTSAGRTDIPVYVGAHKPLMQNYTMTEFFGRDGMEDIDFEEAIVAKTDLTKHASVALVDLARQNAGNVSILALGPVTNIALAVSLDPNFIHNVERFYIMGSCPYGRGSIAPNVDFNFYQDPESNFMLLNSTTAPPAVLLPSGVSRWASIPTKWRTDIIGAIDSKRMKFLNQVERKTFTGGKWKNADLILTALALWPDLVTQTIVTNLTPVFDGAARGTLLVDYRNSTGKQPNAILLEEFDVEKFKQRLLKTFTYKLVT